MLQRRRRFVRGDQRGGAGSVQCQRGAFEAELETHAPADAVEVGAAVGIQADRGLGSARGPFKAAENDIPVFHIADAGVHAGTAALEPVGVESGVLQRSPYRLEHQPMLWIDNLRLDRRHTEERRVELVNVVQETAEPAERPRALGILEHLADAADARTGGGLGDRVPTLVQQAPVGVEVGGAGEPACHTDDGEWFAAWSVFSVWSASRVMDRLACRAHGFPSSAR